MKETVVISAVEGSRNDNGPMKKNIDIQRFLPAGESNHRFSIPSTD